MVSGVNGEFLLAVQEEVRSALKSLSPAVAAIIIVIVVVVVAIVGYKMFLAGPQKVSTNMSPEEYKKQLQAGQQKMMDSARQHGAPAPGR
jgi:hypothetical protein